LWFCAGAARTKKNRKMTGKTLDSRGVIPIIGAMFFQSIPAKVKEVIMTSRTIAFRVYDVSVRDIPEG
jgi:hypothetical protein